MRVLDQVEKGAGSIWFDARNQELKKITKKIYTF
jgi:hypothetical protein